MLLAAGENRFPYRLTDVENQRTVCVDSLIRLKRFMYYVEPPLGKDFAMLFKILQRY